MNICVCDNVNTRKQEWSINYLLQHLYYVGTKEHHTKQVGNIVFYVQLPTYYRNNYMWIIYDTIFWYLTLMGLFSDFYFLCNDLPKNFFLWFIKRFLKNVTKNIPHPPCLYNVHEWITARSSFVYYKKHDVNTRKKQKEKKIHI